MDKEVEESFNEGLILPQVISHLNNILQQYPDDSQILKELIQNAEDAGASTVKFLFDHNSYNSNKKFLFHPEFSDFQGPALYTYNNSVFNDEDWKGLRMVSESVKLKDPFKVGYFGMGFKSVFHITDLPSVLSGDKLGYIDPQQRLFETTTHAFNLQKQKDLLQNYPHQLEPYLNIFDCKQDTFTSGFYNATLFRFPLRKVPSLINNKAYNHEKIDMVIDNFKREAHLLPIFLKHLEKVEIYEKSITEKTPQLTFSMSIAESCINEVRQKRKDFIQKVKSESTKHKCITCTFKLLIETHWYFSSKKFSSYQHKFLVTFLYSNSQMSITFNKLLKNPEINYIPWVGCAMSLDDPKSQLNLNGNLKNGDNHINGHATNGQEKDDFYELCQAEGKLFCFLPLPSETDSHTGLPVFINGFFALEQNRKHLKWPESFNIRHREDLMDKQVLWNVCVLKELLPKCYTTLILEAIKINSSRVNSLFEISEETIYKMFPNSKCVDKKWEEMLYPLYTELIRHEIVFTKANGGSWIEPKSAIFNKPSFNESISNLILTILLEGSVRVVDPPEHFLSAIRKYCRFGMLEVGPSLLSKTLRSLQSSRSTLFKKFTANEKLELLKYFVVNQKFDTLDGLELLPLNDGTFHYFYFNPWKADRLIYIIKDINMLNILPGVDKDLLSRKVDKDVQAFLIRASVKGQTQLKVMDIHTLKDLIPKCFPIKWRSKIAKSDEIISWTPGNIGQPNESWLEELWNFLAENSPRSLTSVETLPILPIRTTVHNNGSKTVDLLPLASNSQIKLLMKDQGISLGNEIQKLAEKVGIVVVEDLPEFVKQHSLVTRQYLFVPTYIGVTKAFQKLCDIQGVARVTQRLQCETTVEDKRNLRNLFSKVSLHEMNKNIHFLFRDLPLFEKVMGTQNKHDSVEFISFNQCQVAAPNEKIDFPLSSFLIDAKDISSQTLGKLLGVEQLDFTQLLEKVVFRDIEGGFYQNDQVKEVMLHVFKNFHRLSDSESSKLKKSMNSLPFMQVNDLLVPVSHFYDPEHELLKQMFVLENRFPDQNYTEKGLLPILREIGLKNAEDVEVEDLKESAEIIALFSGNSFLDENNNKNILSKSHSWSSLEILKNKSVALSEFLHKFTKNLKEKNSENFEELFTSLKRTSWVYISTDKPSFYPKKLNWYGSTHTAILSNDESFIKNHFDKPSNMVSKKYLNLAGSIKTVSHYEFSPEIEKLFGWDLPLDVHTIIKHFKNIVTSYCAYEKVMYSELSKMVYSELAKHDPDVVKKAIYYEDLSKEWIWNGEGFTSSDRIVIVPPFMDLRPFVYSLSLEMSFMKEFFENVADVQNNCNLITVMKRVFEKHTFLNDVSETNERNEIENEARKKFAFSVSEVKKDLHLCVSVLNELKSHLIGITNGENKLKFLQILNDSLYLPIHNDDPSCLKMALLADCTFCDEEWLRQGYSLEDFELDDNEDGTKISLVHHYVPTSTSEALGVPTLMSRMLDAEELDISFGQSDSLTHRLNSLLLEYSDGFAIPKELVQNADDAGATEVMFLYDERENEDAKTCLLDEGMKECQGPALWVYNDAVFTDTDFDNITKLNGATKLNQPDKIGKFGLGFNSVYNITDVPSFVSRHTIVIFDPHTTHLGKSIKDKRKPGIKVDLRRHKKNLKRFGNQFKPYNGIFNCNLKPGSTIELYNGTLFRFPLRTRYQAAKSEISSKHYDDREIKDLLKILYKSASKLLLFSQNVVKIKIFHLPKSGDPSNDVIELFSIEKNLVKILRELPTFSFENSYPDNVSESTLELIKQCCSLKAGVEITKKHKDNITPSSIPTLDSSMIISFNTFYSNSNKSEQFFGTKQKKLYNTFEEWLVLSFLGTKESLQMALTESNLTPNVSLAVPIEGNDLVGYKPIPLTDESNNDKNSIKNTGLIFTFMPLPLKSGLPIHINASFAVTSNRKLLCQKSDDDKFDIRPLWNKVLMEDALTESYMKLLKDLSHISKSESSYNFTSLWPDANLISSSCELMVKKFYSTITNTEEYEILSDEYQWKSFKNSMFIDFQFSKTTMGKIAYEVFSDLNKNVLKTNQIVVYFNEWVQESISYSKIEIENLPNNFSIFRFFKEIFFPNIDHVNPKSRNVLLLYALSLQRLDLNDLLKQFKCIPVTPDGEKLSYIEELIDPTSVLASMYTESDGKFPLSKSSYSQPETLALLKTIGMKSQVEQISWKDMLDRAKTVSQLNSNEETLRKLIRAILQILDTLLEQNEASAVFNKTTYKEIREEFVLTPFLTLLQKPKNYPLKWKGEEFDHFTLLRPQDAYPFEAINLVSSVRPLIDKSLFPHGNRVFKFLLLTIEQCEPSVEDVIKHLNSIIEHPEIESIIHSRFQDRLKAICYEIYDFLQKQLQFNTAEVRKFLINSLKSKPFILTPNGFLEATKVAFNFQHSICMPYLFVLPDSLKRHFYNLFKTIGVRDNFAASDYVKALQEMKKKFDNDQLDRPQIRKAIQIVNCLNECMTEEKISIQNLIFTFGPIYIPDATERLKSASELCFNEPECQWLPKSGAVDFSHPLIPFTVSKRLGVNTNREETLKKHSTGIPFGQHEKLTNRLRNILSGYPCDKEILKELLQNADDSGAREICYIKDDRQHSTERIFDKSWKPLQGPALCIYNDMPFRENDLKAIQKLGEGSKKNDPNKTGQYGVGFNCVYHLTDVPSFLTRGPNTPETLCIFDPHARYVPDSTLQMPGRRYEDIQGLKQLFPDVFSCYLEDTFDMSNGTMFRLPLRNEEMSQSSELSDKVITSHFIDNLFKKFLAELVDCMLFLKNIRKVSFFEIDRLTGKYKTIDVVESKMNENDEIELKKFSELKKKLADTQRSVNLLKIPKTLNSYIIEVHTRGDWETWLVTQVLGCDKDVKIADEIIEAFKNKELLLMPQGGVAVLVDGNNLKVSKAKAKKLFCFLPLPLISEFQVHVNGHFALDYETRRNLWYDEQEISAKTEWNKFLFYEVIANAYVSMLERMTHMVRDYSQPYNDDSIQIDLSYYNNIFPIFNDNTSALWKLNAIGVYQKISKFQSFVIPYTSVQSQSYKTEDGYLMEEETHSINWFSISKANSFKPVFDDLDETFVDDKSLSKTGSKFTRYSSKNEVLRKILLKLKYPLLHANMNIYRCFANSGIKVETISPKSVISYFGSCSPNFTNCNLQNLPQPLLNTPFNNINELRTLLQYCLEDLNFFCLNIRNLPFKLTADNILRPFSSKNQIYITNFSNLFPEHGYKFMHLSILDEIQLINDSMRNNVFLKLDINEFSNILPMVLSEDIFKNKKFVKNDDFKFSPSLNIQWLSIMWQFMRDETKSFEKKEEIMNRLKPIEDWCLLPVVVKYFNNEAVENSSKYLFSLKNFNFVFDFSKNSIMSSPIKNCLRKLNLPELDKDFFKKDDSTFVEPLISNLEDPPSVAKALTFAIAHFENSFGVNESYLLKKYFSDSVSVWGNNNETIILIRNLPIHTTIDDNFTALFDYEVYILLEEIPHMNLNNINNSNILFLKSNAMFSDLYESLNCQLISSSKLYLKFILPNFHSIDTNNWQVHLKFLKDKIIFDENNIERNEIIEILKDLNFIILEDELGSNYFPASHFFDPRNKLFKTLFSDNDQNVFPPAPYSEFKWLEFMRLIGLQSSLTINLFLKFAYEIEQEAYTDFNEKTIEKSKALVANLFNCPFLSDEGFLDSISSIRFIPSVKVKSAHRAIYPAYDDKQNCEENLTTFVAFEEALTEQHEALVWSVSYIIPEWANPFRMIEKTFNQDTEMYNDMENLWAVVSKNLKLEKQPPLNLVIKHLNNICSVNIDENNNAEYKTYLRIDILKKIYGYLQMVISKKDFNEDDDTKEKIYSLRSTPCIISNMGQTFMCPQQIVIDLHQTNQITNYLHKIPLELGEFKKLFLELGATLNVTVKQYAAVLESIYSEAPQARLHPNELKKVFKAVHGFFSVFCETEFDQNVVNEIIVLYLPTISGFLMDSSKIVYIDEPAWKERLGHLNEHFLINLNECKLVNEPHSDMVKRLPDHLRPKLLSKLINERLEEEFYETKYMNAVANKLKCQLNTKAFSLGLARLIKHESKKTGHKIKHEVFDEIQRLLKEINIYAVEKVKTYLAYSDSKVFESESESQCFSEKLYDTEKEILYWEIYIDKSSKLDDELQVRISEIVNKITGNYLKQNIHYIQPILGCPPHSISKVLDRLKIRPDRSNKNDLFTSTLPPAGSFIHIEDHHLLKEDFGFFEAGEYVGYEIYDEFTGEPTYIYAIIHSNVNTENSPKKRTFSSSGSIKNEQDNKKENTKKALQQRYKINIGEEREIIEVSAADLYKFHRVERYVGKDDDLNEKENEKVFKKSSEEEKSNQVISNALVPMKYTKFAFKKQYTATGDDSVFYRQESTMSENSTHDSDKASTNSGETDETGNKNNPKKEISDEDEKEMPSEMELKNEISNTLEEAWKMEGSQRKKIIKRLYLRWHPDKNSGNIKLATSLTQHIQTELERLELGLKRPKTYDSFHQSFHADARNPFAKSTSFQENFYYYYQQFFEQMNRRAKEHKEQKERYRENFNREYKFTNQSRNFHFDVPPTFASSNPQPAQARKFLRQAEEDLKAADNDFSSVNNPAYEWVYIKAHQAAEKALKAAQHFIDASTSYSHDLGVLVSSLEDIELRKLALELQDIVGNANKLYNPAPIDFVIIPHDECKSDTAQKAMELSKAILQKIYLMIEGKD